MDIAIAISIRRRCRIKIASIVNSQEGKEILDRGSWLKGRGFRYLECSSILDVCTHLRNDVEVDDNDEGDDDTFLPSVGTLMIALRYLELELDAN